jgi:hypothetical protein
MNPDAATQSRPAPTDDRRPLVEYAAMIALLMISALASAQLVRGPRFVDHVRVKNPSDLLIDVDVTGKDRDGWLAIAIARPTEMATTKDVVDQGEVWIFRFQSAEHDGGELRVSRDDLERSRWTIAIPAAVIDQLRRAGARPAAVGGI